MLKQWALATVATVVLTACGSTTYDPVPPSNALAKPDLTGVVVLHSRGDTNELVFRDPDTGATRTTLQLTTTASLTGSGGPESHRELASGDWQHIAAPAKGGGIEHYRLNGFTYERAAAVTPPKGDLTAADTRYQNPSFSTDRLFFDGGKSVYSVDYKNPEQQPRKELDAENWAVGPDGEVAVEQKIDGPDRYVFHYFADTAGKIFQARYGYSGGRGYEFVTGLAPATVVLHATGTGEDRYGSILQVKADLTAKTLEFTKLLDTTSRSGHAIRAAVSSPDKATVLVQTDDGPWFKAARGASTPTFENVPKDGKNERSAVLTWV